MVSLAPVLGHDTSNKTVVGVVCDCKSLIHGAFSTLELKHRDNWSEDLLAHNPHVTSAVGENRGFHKETWSVDLVSTSDKAGTLSFTRLDVAQDLVLLGFGDDRPLVVVAITPVPKSGGTHSLGKSLEELVIDALLDDNAG